MARSRTWNSAKHPRASNGRFRSKGRSLASRSAPKTRVTKARRISHPKTRVTKARKAQFPKPSPDVPTAMRRMIRHEPLMHRPAPTQSVVSRSRAAWGRAIARAGTTTPLASKTYELAPGLKMSKRQMRSISNISGITSPSKKHHKKHK